MQEIKITRAQTLKEKPDSSTLVFGKSMTDHMFIVDYDAGQGWHDPRIVPYAPLQIDPAAKVLHYAQEIFEGLKAYRTEDGSIQLFRPLDNVRRMNASAERMALPQIPEDLALAGITELVKVEQDWVPSEKDTSLYIRPFMIADEVSFSVLPAKHYRFLIILSPVGSYYAANDGGLSTTRIYVEDEFIRAALGGTGFAKVGGNYAGGMKASQKAMAYNCKDVLWLDAAEHKYVEEIGTSNAFFMIDGEVITSPLTGTILPGVTRDSVLTLLRKWGVPASERKLSTDELFAAAKAGKLQEVFASGTAAVISPIGVLHYHGQDYTVGDGKVGPIAQRLYDTLYGMQTGKVPDDMGWTVQI